MYAILIAIVGTPLYFGWRLVRALERRAAARNELDELTDRLRRLEDDRETLRREISAAADRHVAIERHLMKPAGEPSHD